MTSDDGELHNPMNLWSLDQRIEAMDADGIDVQLTSPTDVFYQYHQDPAVTATIASAVNDEVAEMVRARPTRIAGLATVPMQDTDLAVAELTRAIRDLGLRKPIYQKTAAYGHFGRDDIEFPWERTDKAEALKSAAGL